MGQTLPANPLEQMAGQLLNQRRQALDFHAPATAAETATAAAKR